MSQVYEGPRGWPGMTGQRGPSGQGYTEWWYAQNPDATPDDFAAQHVGEKGDVGPQGESIPGPQGPPGESIPGPQGPPGESIPGPKGDTGPAGEGTETPISLSGYASGVAVGQYEKVIDVGLLDIAGNPVSFFYAEGVNSLPDDAPVGTVFFTW